MASNHTSQLEKIVEFLKNSKRSPSDAAQAFNLHEDRIMEMVARADSIEHCELCGWWQVILEGKHFDHHQVICRKCHDKPTDYEPPTTDSPFPSLL
jgi:hypothetical protein